MAKLPDRFMEKVSVRRNGCWEWTACGNPYGMYHHEGKTQYAHIVAYTLMKRPVPAGKQLDHKCRNPQCVNPAHLEPVTIPINRKRAGEAVTKCLNGHKYTEENTYRNAAGHRECKQCRVDRNRKWRKQQAREGRR